MHDALHLKHPTWSQFAPVTAADHFQWEQFLLNRTPPSTSDLLKKTVHSWVQESLNFPVHRSNTGIRRCQGMTLGALSIGYRALTSWIELGEGLPFSQAKRSKYSFSSPLPHHSSTLKGERLGWRWRGRLRKETYFSINMRPPGATLSNWCLVVSKSH